MTHAARATGTRDAHYDVISILYHTLQEGDNLSQYIEDAKQAGDQELCRFFRDVQTEDRQRAERAKEILRQRLGQTD